MTATSMPSNHQALLDEFKIAIDKLVPTVPADVVAEAKELHKRLSENPDVTEEQIHNALVQVGKAEFAYRRAYHELAKSASEEHRVELVLEHLEPEVKVKVQKYLESGVTLDELVKSSMFEIEFTAEERYQVEDGILHAVDHLKEELPEKIEAHKDEYNKLVKEWQKKQAKMEEKLEELKGLAEKDANCKAEILERVKFLEEGWSVVERDPELQDIENEIEYWKNEEE